MFVHGMVLRGRLQVDTHFQWKGVAGLGLVRFYPRGGEVAGWELNPPVSMLHSVETQPCVFALPTPLGSRNEGLTSTNELMALLQNVSAPWTVPLSPAGRYGDFVARTVPLPGKAKEQVQYAPKTLCVKKKAKGSLSSVALHGFSIFFLLADKQVGWGYLKVGI